MAVANKSMSADAVLGFDNAVLPELLDAGQKLFASLGQSGFLVLVVGFGPAFRSQLKFDESYVLVLKKHAVATPGGWPYVANQTLVDSR